MVEINRICCIGAGCVGGPTTAVIADRCPDVQMTVVDLKAERISSINDIAALCEATGAEAGLRVWTVGEGTSA